MAPRFRDAAYFQTFGRDSEKKKKVAIKKHSKDSPITTTMTPSRQSSKCRRHIFSRLVETPKKKGTRKRGRSLAPVGHRFSISLGEKAWSPFLSICLWRSVDQGRVDVHRDPDTCYHLGREVSPLQPRPFTRQFPGKSGIVQRSWPDDDGRERRGRSVVVN